jgi:hypothetical protein
MTILISVKVWPLPQSIAVYWSLALTMQFCGRVNMRDEERLIKNELCERLMKDGIDGRPDEAAYVRICSLMLLAEELGRQDARTCVLSWFEAMDQRSVGGELAVLLDFSRANAIAGERYGTQWKWEQPTLARELFYLRRAVSRSEFAQIPDVTKCMCLNNLGHRLLVAGRCVEALDTWHRVLEILPSFGMSLCNRAKALAHYADALDDEDLRPLFLWAAHKDASAAIATTATYTAARDAGNRKLANSLKEWIESLVDIKGIDSAAPLTQEIRRIEPDERDYVLWCVKNCLYLNPINDLGPHTVAAYDALPLVMHVVPVDAPYIFESFFDQMKQEYVSARWLLYEGLMLASPHFSDREVLLSAAEPRPCLSLSTEKLKAAFRISYSLFDKVSFFINAYMGLGIEEKSVSFRTLWKTGDKKAIRPQFDSTTNWGFCALYWLAKDFFEKPSDDVAEPHARALCEIRNHIEHKYLRVSVAETPTAPPDDLALTVSRVRFGRDALHVLKLARSALIYLDISVRYEEQRRESDRAGLALEEIPIAPHLSDAEKF